ncbi:heparan sulfate N-deacetylase N-sulfotransferase [Octopus vulgaris]|uniref:[heparan sulfate]-glucosamine N-sulfotransferase n=1 Tax=Octopus vulgaris TaxID=6645 RepID=A0AA36AWK8_OCTVU|nr:heparan sulfate N-deacetylase N-sulfotransferase [Octopus vulgaris]
MYSRRCFVWLKNSLLWKSNFRKCSLTKILIALFSLSSLSFLAYQCLIDHSHVKRHEIPVSTIECRLNPVSGGMFSPSDHSSSSNHRIDNKVLVIVETQYSYLGQDIIHLLEAIRVKYKVEPNGKTLPYLTHGNKGKYSAIIFENFDAYVNMDAWNRELLDKYCRDFNVGIISFVASRDNIAYSKRMKDFPLTIYQYMAIEDYELNPMSNIWRITRPGEIIRGPLKDDEWVIFQFEHATYKPLSYAKLSRNYGRYIDLSGNTVFPAIQDLGLLDGIQKVIFGNGLRFWLHCLVFLDSLSYLSHGKLSLPLDRYVLIDIDDVFVGAAGKRMKVSDVHALLAAQNRLRSHIKGFYFNLGFSGKYYQKGTPEENLGDRLLVANSDKFWWFGHTWMHTQAHFHENASSLEEDMSLNKEFAQKYNIPVVNNYAVAPHHSGVYPVHEPLYEAWHKVWNITVSSTEEYLHLRPARRRRGFFYRGIKVLPRQTCGLYTHNLLIDKYPGGREKLDASIRGGELFQTFLYNKVNIFMTHMCNYGSDRLALYTFESAVKFLQCWTNLHLQTIPPQDLAQVYFSSYPDELNPIWVNPCRDKRHLAIWSPRKVCNTLPHLIVIGPQKTGTTAIYTFLNMHPSIRSNVKQPVIFEELHFFSSDQYYNKGLDWYMNAFKLDNPNQTDIVFFEKTAAYFDNPMAPMRIASLIPDVKLVLILLDPIKRAYSWYQHARAHQNPASLNYTFYEIITAGEGSHKIQRDLRNRCLNPSLYAQHLERWLDYFHPSQLLILDGQEIKENPPLVMSKIQKFIEVKPYIDFRKLLRYDAKKKFYCQVLSTDNTKCLGPGKGRVYPPMEESAYRFLKMFFRRHNVALSKLLMKLNQATPVPAWLKEDLQETL